MQLNKGFYTNHKCFTITLLSLWAAFLLTQAYFTPLHVDECYYWLYGQNLDWGFFDHPPGVALLIYLSDFFGSGTISVRFFTIVSQVLTLVILYRIIDNPLKKQNSFFLTFFLFFICLPLNHIYGFITTPDVPLILSASLFFLAYKNVLLTNKLSWSILWGITMAAMLYSKYHGVLVIFFVLCSNPKLFLNIRTYLAGIIGILLFLPHLSWQFDHDFVSFVYHLKDRVVVYKQFYPLEYLLNIVLVFNPFFLLFLWRVLKRYKRGDFERSLYVTLIGFLLFFGMQSFRVHVQPQWIVLVYIPFVILVFNYIEATQLKGINQKALISVPFLLLLHVFMIWDLLPPDLNLHRKKTFVEEVERDARGKPVMFYSSYNHASIYSWYSRQKYTHSYNGPTNRKNQFNIWEQDSVFHNKEVYLVGTYYHDPGDKIYEGGYSGIDIEYKALDNLDISVLGLKEYADSITAEIEIANPYSVSIDFEEDNKLAVYFLSNDKSRRGRHIFTSSSNKIQAHSSKTLSLTFPYPDLEIDQIGFSISGKKFPFGPIGHKYKFEDFRE